MKQGIHPTSFRFVVFKDMSNDFSFLSRSTAKSNETIVWEDGKEYPVIKLEVSNTSHPFYTGEVRQASNEGRVASFNKRFKRFKR